MSLTYCVLASGSGGNCMWVRGGGVSILVDCGISARVVARRLAAIGVDIADVSAVVCTHGHSDHVAGAAVLARRHDVDVFATPPTFPRIPGRPPAERLRVLPVDGVVTFGGLTVRTIATMHDVPGSVALVISDGDTALGVVTDLGRPTTALVDGLSGVAALAVECNHDLHMLRDGAYPPRLKRRIRSEVGHLSNEQSARLLASVLHPNLQHLTLLHLSEHNNTPLMAVEAMQAVLVDRGASPYVSVGEQHCAGAPVALRSHVAKQLVMPWRAA